MDANPSPVGQPRVERVVPGLSLCTLPLSIGTPGRLLNSMAYPSSSTQARRTPWFDVLFVGGLVAILTFGSAWLLISQNENDRARILDEDAALIFKNIEDGLRRIESDLLATKGLFDASDEVDNEEFNQFASTMGVLDRVAVVGLIRLVDHGDLPAFEREMNRSIPGYRVFGVIGGVRVDPPDVAVHELVAAMAHRDDFPDGLGLDASSVEAMPPAVEAALDLEAVITTSPYRFALTDEVGVITVLPLDPEPGEPPGVLFAGKHVSEMIAEQVPVHLHGLFDVGLTTDAVESVQDAGLSRLAVIEFGGREWLVTARARPSSAYLAPIWETPIVLGIAMLLTFLASVLAHSRSRHQTIKAELAAARYLNDEKDKFLSSISHQLRTPLTMVSGFTKQLLESWDTFSEANRIEFLAIVDEQADEMEWLVHNLLVASRAESGLATVEAVPTDLCQVVTRVMRRLPDTGDRALRHARSSVSAMADPFRTEQVIRNLLVNALDHGGSEVEVMCFTKGDEAVIEIRDNGEGVPDAVAESIFDRYSHAETRLPLASTGLGLDVSRTLVELMGGSLTYCREDGITVFSVRLPAAEGPEQQPTGVSSDRDEAKLASGEHPDRRLS